MRPVNLIGALAAGAVALVCQNTRLAAPAAIQVSAETEAGAQEQSINGMIVLVSNARPGEVLATPGGQCHLSDVPGFTEFTGDVAGPVTFHRRVVNTTCGGGRITGAGPFDGDVTWNGLSGIMSGQWETNCTPNASQPTGVSCDGTMNARGSGGLEGVEFHFKWGPGWFPFPYSGTAISH